MAEERSTVEATQVEKDLKLAATVRDADVVILMKANPDGIGAVAYFKHLSVEGGIPWTADVDFGEADDPDGTIRRVSVKAGWNAADWRKLDRSGLHSAEQEATHA